MVMNFLQNMMDMDISNEKKIMIILLILLIYIGKQIDQIQEVLAKEENQEQITI